MFIRRVFAVARRPHVVDSRLVEVRASSESAQGSYSEKVRFVKIERVNYP